MSETNNDKNDPIMTSHMTQDGRQREIYRVFSCHYFKVISGYNKLIVWQYNANKLYFNMN